MESFHETPRDRFLDLVDEIINEEYAFRARMLQMEIDAKHLEEEHERMKHECHPDECHGRLRAVHSAMFKVHRKIFREHQIVLDRCLAIARRLDQSPAGKEEMARLYDQLKTRLHDIRTEHKKLEKERSKLLEEHRRFTSGLGAD